MENDVENEMSGNLLFELKNGGFRKQDTRRDPQGRDGVYPAWDTPIFQQENSQFREIVFHEVLQKSVHGFHVKQRALFNIYHFYEPIWYPSLNSPVSKAEGFRTEDR